MRFIRGVIIANWKLNWSLQEGRVVKRTGNIWRTIKWTKFEAEYKLIDVDFKEAQQNKEGTHHGQIAQNQC